jgi:hypothetical protein
MAEKNKSIIESALLDAKRIQEALNANTKEILRSVAIEEIDGLVKESLEEGYVEEDADEETEDVTVTADDEVADDVADDSEEVADDSEFTSDDSEEGDDLEGGDDIGMSAEPLGGDTEVRDMTQASDDDVIKVYKELTGDSEIEVVVDDETGDIKLSVNEPGEFIIKTNVSASEPDGDEFSADEFGADEFGAEGGADEFGGEEEEVDEVMYEIALDEMENIDGIKAPLGNENDDNWAGDNLEGGFDEKKAHAKAEGDMVMSEGEDVNEGGYNQEYDANMAEYCKANPNDAQCKEGLEESIPVGSAQAHRLPGKADIGQPKGAGADNLKESKKPTMTINEVANKYNTLLAEAKDLRGRNEEYKEALKQFRTMLAETVVFNSNLTYVTKLFMEQTTTKDEKQAILKRFDEEVSTLKESKRLYKTIVNELSSRKPMNESIDRKLNKDVSSGVSKQLNESTAYIDKETQRIKDLMSRVEKR